MTFIPDCSELSLLGHVVAHLGWEVSARWRSLRKMEADVAKYPKIWFLRHGQTEWNAEHRLQGQLDSPLTGQGIADARRQAVLMSPVLVDRPVCVASPLGRARHTAEIALGETPFATDPLLMEIHSGAWQGHRRDDILAENRELAQRNPNGLELYAAAPQGEGFAAFKTRIVAFLDTLSVPTVVVAHGLLGQVLRGYICGLDRAGMGALSNQQGCVYLLENGTETVLELSRT